MKKDEKTKMIIISLLGVLFGRILNRILPNYFGDDSSNIIMTGVLVVIFCIILILVVMKYYLIAIWAIIMAIPLGIAGIGVYKNDTLLMGVGLLLIAAVSGISAIVLPKVANKNK